MNNMNKVVKNLRDAFLSGRTKNLEFRKEQLRALVRMYEENEAKFVEALFCDLHKPKQESILMEVFALKEDIRYILSNIDQWSELEKVPSTLLTLLEKTLIYHDPYGVVLVISAWNFPLALTLQPVSGAIAAGNCIIIKPSEVSPATSKLIAQLIPKYLDPECYKVVTGGVAETTELLREKFDYIFYTGSAPVGKIVREASNKHLTPTTLELGGKCPLYLDDNVDMDVAVRRILWGKCINLGQTCVAPDYVLMAKETQDKFIVKAREVLREWYGDNPQKSSDLTRIVNEKHFNRVMEYLKDGTIAIGGRFEAEDKFIEPTILTDVVPGSKVMEEEIFGPILPIINVGSAEEAIRFINAREEEPLAMYLFTMDSKIQKSFCNEVRCGSICINDCIVHLGGDNFVIVNK